MRERQRHILPFIEESNRIEGITIFSKERQIAIMENFLLAEKITVELVVELATGLQVTSMVNNELPILRDKKGLNVRVGNE